MKNRKLKSPGFDSSTKENHGHQDFGKKAGLKEEVPKRQFRKRASYLRNYCKEKQINMMACHNCAVYSRHGLSWNIS